MNAKKEIFERYKKEYYKAKVAVGGRSALAEIISTVKSVTGMHQKSIIRAFNRMQGKHPLGEEHHFKNVPCSHCHQKVIFFFSKKTIPAKQKAR